MYVSFAAYSCPFSHGIILSALERIYEECPSSIVCENGLAALFNYLDFFSIIVQCTALQAASNQCQDVSHEHFQMIHGVWPIISGLLRSMPLSSLRASALFASSTCIIDHLPPYIGFPPLPSSHANGTLCCKDGICVELGNESRDP